MKSSIVILALIVIVSGTSLQNEIQKKVAEYADHPFGQTMVNLLSVNMETGEPLQELSQLLQQIKDEIITLIETQDQDYSAQQRRCEVDVAQLTATTTQASSDLEAQRAEQKSFQEEESTLTKRVAEDSNALERNARSQQETEDRLNNQDGNYESKYRDYSQAILACKEAQRLLMNLNSDSFIQLSRDAGVREDIKRITQSLQDHSQKTSLPLFQPIIEGLLEMSTEINRETLNNVLGLIARLIIALQEGQEQLRKSHESQISNMKKLQFDLSNEQTTLENSIKNGNNRIRQIQSRLNELDTVLYNSESIAVASQANLDGAKAQCKRNLEAYNKQGVNRTSELDIVDRLIQFVEDRIANTP